MCFRNLFLYCHSERSEVPKTHEANPVYSSPVFFLQSVWILTVASLPQNDRLYSFTQSHTQV